MDEASLDNACGSSCLTNARQFELFSSAADLDRHLALEEIEAEGELRAEVSCPYCHEVYELTELCAHLECEHCFEMKPVVCPVCTDRVWTDLFSHITTEHSHFFKGQRRRRSFRASPADGSVVVVGKEWREGRAQILLSRGTSHPSSSSTGADALLSALSKEEQLALAGLAGMGPTEGDKAATTTRTEASAERPLSVEQRQEKQSLAVLRATFARQIMMSAIFGD